MNKKINKSLDFLKGRLISLKGIFDNKSVYENTLSAFEEAIKNNLIIELQVKMMKCGTLVVFGDDTMDRLLHVEGRVEDITYDELCYMATYDIPTFESVLNLISGRVPIIIEVKSKTKRNAIEIKVAELMDKYNGDYAIESFNLSTLKWFNKNRQSVVIGYLMGKKNYKSEPIFFKKYDFLNVNYELFNDKKIRKIREEKMVLGHIFKTLDEIKSKRDVYDNLCCDNVLEINEL